MCGDLLAGWLYRWCRKTYEDHVSGIMGKSRTRSRRARTVQSFCCLCRLQCCPPSSNEKGALGTTWFSPVFRPLYWKVLNRLSLPRGVMVFASFASFFQRFSRVLSGHGRIRGCTPKPHEVRNRQLIGLFFSGAFEPQRNAVGK